MVVVRRALFSCYDKTGLEAFAKGLAARGVKLIASSGTAASLQQAGLTVTTIESFTGMTEQLEGRVKTLHPRIHAGILARRDEPSHVKAVGDDALIDLVVVNVYPFRETSQRPGASLQEVLEHIDIGGVALLRAAAKNFPHVTVVADPAQYPRVLAAFQEGEGSLPESLSRELAAGAFLLTSRYDQWIATYVARTGGTEISESPESREDPLPGQVTLQARKHQALRYGENPHQRAAWYIVPEGTMHPGGVVPVQGKALSYNNILDVDTVTRCLSELEGPACVIVKHASVCGVAAAETIHDAYARALACDSESAFGGIVGVTRPLDAATASKMLEIFVEVIVAPSIESDAKGLIAKKPNLRLLEWTPDHAQGSLEWRSVQGGWLVQEHDRAAGQPSIRVVTTQQPSASQRRDLLFAWLAVKHVKSNAIVVAHEEATVGIGQGQPSRVRAVRLALQHAGPRARGAVLASEAFFPFPDNIELAAHAGVTAIIQPGGSVKDQAVIDAANQAGLAMCFTGIRHFRH